MNHLLKRERNKLSKTVKLKAGVLGAFFCAALMFMAAFTALSLGTNQVAYVNADIADDYPIGAGTSSNPYIISTAAELQGLKDYCGAAYKDLHFKNILTSFRKKKHI
jgi:hypothetical protein